MRPTRQTKTARSPAQQQQHTHDPALAYFPMDWSSEDESNSSSEEEYIPPNRQKRKRSNASVVNDESQESLCQYQTSPQAVKQVLTRLASHVQTIQSGLPIDDSFDMWIEPSAGEGTFYDALPHQSRRGIDIDSSLKAKHPDYIIGDFLKMDRESLSIPSNVTRARTVVIGNPPFSTVGSFRGGLRNPVVDFINHASTLADTIIFIVPPTMNRPALQDRVNRDLHLVVDEPLQSSVSAFEQTSRGTRKIVSCRVQLWVRDAKQPSRPLRYRGVPRVKRNDGSWTWEDGTPGDFVFLFPTDPQVNLLVSRFGYIGNLVSEPSEIQAIQQRLDKTKQTVIVTRGATAYFHLHCRDVAAVKSRFESPVAQKLLEEYRQACVGTAACLNLRDIVRIYVESSVASPALGGCRIPF